MNIPSSLKIGGHNITVSVEELSDMAGEWDSAKNLIRIDKNQSQSQKEVALIHEILHVINSEMSGDGYAHALLESLAQQLYQVLSDNRMLR